LSPQEIFKALILYDEKLICTLRAIRLVSVTLNFVSLNSHLVCHMHWTL